MEVSDQSVPSQNEDVIERSGEEELLLFHAGLGKLFEVNRVGREIWRLCDGERTISEIVEELERRFETSDTIERDVSSFVEELLRMDLLRVS